MTPARVLFWRRVQARVAVEIPDVSAKILRAFQVLRDSLSDRELMQLITDRLGFEVVVKDVLSDSVLDRVFMPVQEQLQTVTQRGMQYFGKNLPNGGIVDGASIVSFNVLSPNVRAAIEALDTKVIQTLKDDVREVVRRAVAAGLESGASPATTARGLRDVIGLAPNQLDAVNNYRAQLIAGDKAALRRALIDKRFGKKVVDLTPEQIDARVAAYRRRWVTFNTNTNARTATADAFRAAQRLAWQQGIDAGIVNGEKLKHQWIGIDDGNERPAHVRMNNQIRPFGERYSNGQLIPGESDWNCRCLDRFFVGT